MELKKEYHEYYDLAITNLQAIEIDPMDAWRMQQLYYMSENYNESIIEAMDMNSRRFPELATHINWSYEAIMDTSNDYFRLVADQSTSLKSDLSRISNFSLVLGLSGSVLVVFILRRNSHRLANALIEPMNVIINDLTNIEKGNYQVEPIEANIIEIDYLASKVR